MRGSRRSVDQAAYYAGVRMVPYDLVKELVLALAGTAILVLVLAAVLSSPDVPPVTIQSWAQADPTGFERTAVQELQGQSTSAQYGPPYNHATGSVQSFGFIQPQEWAGVHLPVDPARDFVLQPLQTASAGNPQLASALARYRAASPGQRSSWLDAYAHALDKATVRNGQVVVPPGSYGPMAEMLSNLLTIARSGALDGQLRSSTRFYQTDFTRPLLFLGDGDYFAGLAQEQHLLGSQWGVMNETGSYPGQTWLWLYTMWYQIPPYNASSSADLLVILSMGVLTVALALVPFIPGLRDIPRWIPVHRLIWRGSDR
ncbi:MAG TPA: hypothetical protein VFD49_05890 [Candidatus Dormibacteraeota bacterium]|nr:hypothetical protein [Candidatus Dormibacteraeota bacterium]